MKPYSEKCTRESHFDEFFVPFFANSTISFSRFFRSSSTSANVLIFHKSRNAYLAITTTFVVDPIIHQHSMRSNQPVDLLSRRTSCSSFCSCSGRRTMPSMHPTRWLKPSLVETTRHVRFVDPMVSDEVTTTVSSNFSG